MGIRKLLTVALVAMVAGAGRGAYRQIGTSTEPNSWTCNFYGVLEQAAKTGYPILYIDVNSATCSHCHTLSQLTLASDEFRALEKDLVFYLVMTDDASMDTAGGSRLYDTYSQYYYNGSGYPLVAVIAKDGSVYGSFNRTTTDNRNIASDLRKLIEQLSMVQMGKVLHTDGTESSADAPAPTKPDNQPAPVAAAKPTTLAGWISALKGKTTGVYFDSNEKLVGTLSLNFNAKGVATSKWLSFGGRETTKASLEIDEGGNPTFSANGMKMTYDYDNRLWIGEKNGGKAFASKSSASGFDGLYTLSANAASKEPGYLTLTAKNGKGRVAGMLNGRNKISANGVGIVLPASVVASSLPQWNAGGDLALYPVFNAGKGICGALTAVKTGAASGTLRAVGKNWDASGEKWDVSTNLKPLNGLSVKVGGYEVPVVASDSKIVAGENGYGAKLQAMVKKGIFKGSLKLPAGRLTFEGALIGSGTKLRGAGVSYGVGVLPVALGSADECSECTFDGR